MHDDLKQRLRHEVEVGLGSRPRRDLSDVLTRGRSKRLVLRLVTTISIILLGTALIAGGSWIAGVRSLSNDAAPIPPGDEIDNKEPRAVTYSFPDVDVTLRAAEPWTEYSAPDGSTVQSPSEWAGGPVLALEQDSQEHLGLDADPRSVGTGCQPGVAPADVETLVRELRSDEDLKVTAPVAVSVGGVDALRMDIRAASGAGPCSKWGPAYPPAPMALAQWLYSPGVALEDGSRMRLYLLDTPWRGENWTRRVFALWIVAPETRFEHVAQTAQPILESIEFHAR